MSSKIFITILFFSFIIYSSLAIRSVQLLDQVQSDTSCGVQVSSPDNIASQTFKVGRDAGLRLTRIDAFLIVKGLNSVFSLTLHDQHGTPIETSPVQAIASIGPGLWRSFTFTPLIVTPGEKLSVSLNVHSGQVRWCATSADTYADGQSIVNSELTSNDFAFKTYTVDCAEDNDCPDSGSGCAVGKCTNSGCDVAVANDNNPCTYDSKVDNPDPDVTGSEVCHWTIPGCITCSTNADCDDGDSCTFDWCQSTGICANSLSDFDSCTFELGDQGVDVNGNGLCHVDIGGGTKYPAIPNCVRCNQDSDCPARTNGQSVKCIFVPATGALIPPQVAPGNGNCYYYY